MRIAIAKWTGTSSRLAANAQDICALKPHTSSFQASIEVMCCPFFLLERSPMMISMMIVWWFCDETRCLDIMEVLLGVVYHSLYHISWHFMTFHDISWHFMTFHDISWHFMTVISYGSYENPHGDSIMIRCQDLPALSLRFRSQKQCLAATPAGTPTGPRVGSRVFGIEPDTHTHMPHMYIICI